MEGLSRFSLFKAGKSSLPSINQLRFKPKSDSVAKDLVDISLPSSYFEYVDCGIPSFFAKVDWDNPNRVLYSFNLLLIFYT